MYEVPIRSDDIQKARKILGLSHPHAGMARMQRWDVGRKPSMLGHFSSWKWCNRATIVTAADDRPTLQLSGWNHDSGSGYTLVDRFALFRTAEILKLDVCPLGLPTTGFCRDQAVQCEFVICTKPLMRLLLVLSYRDVCFPEIRAQIQSVLLAKWQTRVIVDTGAFDFGQ